jgi:hypothetical protein
MANPANKRIRHRQNYYIGLGQRLCLGRNRNAQLGQASPPAFTDFHTLKAILRQIFDINGDPAAHLAPGAHQSDNGHRLSPLFIGKLFWSQIWY